MTKVLESTWAAPRLLVSVRDAVEAETALAAGVTLLDVKEPLSGSLGAASVGAWQEVVASAQAHTRKRLGNPSARKQPCTVSVALGELLDYRLRALPPGISLAKLGLAGCLHFPAWQEKWRTAIDSLPAGVNSVAVVYADYHRAQAPTPEHILGTGCSLGCRYVLVDTFDKSHGSLPDLWSLAQISTFVRLVHSQGLRIVLAGSLSLDNIRELLPLQPDAVAVRGAACEGDRTSGISSARVHELLSLVEDKCADRQLAHVSRG